MSSNMTVGNGGGEGSFEDIHRLRAYYQDTWENSGGGGVSEIEEEFSGETKYDREINPLESIREEVENSSVFSFDFHGEGGHDVVYVAIGKHGEESTSMDALIWALDNIVTPISTVVFLIHVFPEIKFIPTPLGKLPISQVNPVQKESHMAQERGKRRELLQKFINVCSNSQVKVDTILVESDMEARAILDLIPILNITKLVLGTTKTNARRMRSKKGNGVSDQVLHSAPESCEVKIICEGKEMSELAMESPSPSQSPRASSDRSLKSGQELKQIDNNSVACGCFKL